MNIDRKIVETALTFLTRLVNDNLEDDCGVLSCPDCAEWRPVREVCEVMRAALAEPQEKVGPEIDHQSYATTWLAGHAQGMKDGMSLRSQRGCAQCGAGKNDNAYAAGWWAALEAKREQDATTDNAIVASHAKRLAMELECLLLECGDNASIRWWESGHEALENYRADLDRLYPQDHVSPMGSE